MSWHPTAVQHCWVHSKRAPIHHWLPNSEWQFQWHPTWVPMWQRFRGVASRVVLCLVDIWLPFLLASDQRNQAVVAITLLHFVCPFSRLVLLPVTTRLACLFSLEATHADWSEETVATSLELVQQFYIFGLKVHASVHQFILYQSRCLPQLNRLLLLCCRLCFPLLRGAWHVPRAWAF